MMRRWHHGHTLVAGVAVGAGIMQGPLGAFLLFSGGVAIGLVGSWLIHRARDAARYAGELVDARERRANARVALDRDRSERASARLALQVEKARRFAGVGPTDEVPF